ncbi:MAG: hypothetical protein ACI4TL_03995 [Candidatus Cryptobacteroides sp.]
MKDIVIKERRIRREVIVALVCFLLSFLTNMGAVIFYAKPWVEIFTQIGYVFIIAVVFYVIALIIRLLYLLIIKIFKIK